MGGYLRLARPLNCLMSAVGVYAGGIVAVGAKALGEFALPLALAALAALSFTAAGNALNDISDRRIDAINHPERPLPSGRVSLRGAQVFTASAFALAGVLASQVNSWALSLVAINTVLMVAYEASLKARGGPGNIVIAFLVASLFLFGGLSTLNSLTTSLQRSGSLSFLAFFVTLGREITKDIEDMRGDVDRRTIPQRMGAKRAGLLASAALLVGVGLSGLPVAYRLLSPAYSLLVIPADGMFIYAALYSAANPARSQRVTKYAMVVALVAFLAGGLL